MLRDQDVSSKSVKQLVRCVVTWSVMWRWELTAGSRLQPLKLWVRCRWQTQQSRSGWLGQMIQPREHDDEGHPGSEPFRRALASAIDLSWCNGVLHPGPPWLLPAAEPRARRSPPTPPERVVLPPSGKVVWWGLEFCFKLRGWMKEWKENIPLGFKKISSIASLLLLKWGADVTADENKATAGLPVNQLAY